jgi:hypothetical protein
MSELDVTAQIRTALAEALSGGRTRVLLVVSASNCPGCEQLARQLKRPEVVRLLDERTTVLTVSAGDLYDDPADSVRIGHWTLQSPGYPCTWIFEPDDGGLSFCSLILGPMPGGIPEAELSAAFAGTSVWPDEASGIKLRVCTGPVCLVLREDNGFRSDFRIRLA